MRLPGKVERVTGYSICAIVLAGPIVVAIWSRSLIIYAFAGSVLVFFLGALLVRKLKGYDKLSEEETTRRVDKAMGKPPGDPRQMGRFVP